MLEALAYSRNGGIPVYVIHSLRFEGYCRSLWEYLGGEPREVKFMTPRHEFRGLTPESVFIDHHVFDVGFYNPGLEYMIAKQREAGDSQ